MYRVILFFLCKEGRFLIVFFEKILPKQLKFLVKAQIISIKNITVFQNINFVRKKYFCRKTLNLVKKY